MSFKKGKLEPKRYFGVLKEELKILTFETLGTRFLKETKIVQQFWGDLVVVFFCFQRTLLCTILQNRKYLVLENRES